MVYSTNYRSKLLMVHSARINKQKKKINNMFRPGSVLKTYLHLWCIHRHFNSPEVRTYRILNTYNYLKPVAVDHVVTLLHVSLLRQSYTWHRDHVNVTGNVDILGNYDNS